MTTASEMPVITGIGIFSPIGIGVDAVWESLSTKRSGIGRSILYPGLAANDQVCAEVRDFTDESARKLHLKELRKNLKAMCREIQLGVASALQALTHSALDMNAIDHERLGIDFGANLMFSAPDMLKDGSLGTVVTPGVFDFNRWGEHGFPRMEPLWLLRYLPNMPACHIGITTDARGPSNSLTMDDASACTAIGEATRVLQRNAADIMITGSTGTAVHPIKTLHWALCEDMAVAPEEPHRRARPFDLHRTGRVPGEGAATLILEQRAFAEARGATIYGMVRGVGASCVNDGKGHVGYRQALANAMRSAVRAAGLEPADIGHINAHGLGAVEVDAQEASAIHDVFGPELGTRIPVTAPKSFLGNAGAGAGMMELVSSIIALRHGVLPATLNYETPDPRCPLNIVTELLPAQNRTLLKLNVTAVGQAVAAVIDVA